MNPSEGTNTDLPRIPKKKEFTVPSNNAMDLLATAAAISVVGAPDNGINNVGDEKMGDTSNNTDPPKRKAGRPPKNAAATKISSSTTTLNGGLERLRKGDLVRLSHEQKSGRIQGGLARITRCNFSPNDDAQLGEPISYDIEYVLGGKVSNIERYELTYTTATAEGLIDASDGANGHSLRTRRRPKAMDDDDDDEGDNKKAKKTKKKDGRGRPPGSKNKRKTDDSAAGNEKKRRGPKKSSVDSVKDAAWEMKSQSAKLGWEKRRANAAAAGAGPKAKARPGRKPKRNSATDDSDVTSGVEEFGTDAAAAAAQRRKDLYKKQRRELEKSLQRIEKVDRFGFFLDSTPAEFDENYDDDDEQEKNSDTDDGEDDTSPIPRKKAVQFPDQPPFNFHIIRKRLAAGRYDVDRVVLEMKRRNEIKNTLKTDETNGEVQAEDMTYDEIAKSMYHPIAVDWDTFQADVFAMCDAATIRDPEGLELGSGHLGWAANKVKKATEDLYNTFGSKRRAEVEESEANGRYYKVLESCSNTEAAVQGDWRKEAFPERKYERLEKSSVICDGLPPKDRAYAMYELETKLPDSFVGLAYTYDDSGQHSETWMKTVADETQAKPKKARKKLIFEKQDSTDESVSLVSSKTSDNKAQKAAMALAKDDGVVRAQVQTTMSTLLIQVQDRVMTDLGVMHSPEARSANWDDGDQGRDYRGGGSYEIEQGTHSGFSLPEVAEQEVWGIDCYTRKNVMSLIESEFTGEIAIEFVQKWLLPAINACPVDLAHKMSTACRILEGLDPIPPDTSKAKSLEDDSALTTSTDKVITRQSVEAMLTLEKVDSIEDGNKLQESCVFLRNAMESKIKEHGPPWLKAAARTIRLASDSMEDDFFRIHPKGHGSVVIGENGLKANSLVTYYRGEVYPAWRWCEKLDAIEQIQKQLDLRPNLPDFYNMAMERPKKDPRGYCLLFVDASRKSGLGSSFSHSCNPTCEVRVVSLNGKLSLSMTTLRDLEQGEELTFDYNAVTESLNEFRFAVCLCGQKKCRGSFLHFATADCYQQVLSRNSPISARFANLVRGCMKQVMSKEDTELLLKHGFNTAAFGAVSFNHHVSSVNPNATPDSINNVPVWLRTFVADCLRYIEYERRALPVALLCNQMERMSKQKGKGKTKKKLKRAPSKDSSSSSTVATKPSTKSIPGSKPVSSYFFYLQKQRSKYEASLTKEENKLTGLARAQAINKKASNAWSNFSEEEKEVWKKKSIADWKKNGGKEKARLEKERLRALEMGASGTVQVKEEKDEVDKENDQPVDVDIEHMEAKTISFADADAEGFSAMEQRVQQLAQSLSRVGRVLDRHRESVFEERKDLNSTVDSNLLCSLVHSPLKIMSDGDVVNWIWFGVVPQLMLTIERHFPKKSLLLRQLLSSIIESYPVLSAFTENYAVPSLNKKFKHSCTSADARKLVREALLKLRSKIMTFLNFAEKSVIDARNEKRKEKARLKKLKQQQQEMEQQNPSSTTMTDDQEKDDVEMEDNQPSVVQSHESTALKNLFSMGAASSHTEDEAMPMRGGGGGATDPNGFIASSILSQAAFTSSAVQPAQPTESSNTAVQVNNDTLIPPPPQPAPQPQPQTHVSQAPVAMNVPSHSAAPAIVPSTISEDVQALLGFSKSPNNFGTAAPPVSSNPEVSTQNNQHPTAVVGSTQTSEVNAAQAEVGTPSPSRLQDLINAASNNSKGSAAATTLSTTVQPVITTAQPVVLPEGLPLTLPEGLMSTPHSTGTKSDAGVNSQGSGSDTKKPKKSVTPLSDDQVKYLKEWLFDPKHILNPYPTDEEKDLMFKDTGIERKRLEGWLIKNRQKILYPEARPVQMKWKKVDEEHWSDFYKKRYMLEATADMLLMYANTNTFFMLEPYRQFDSTPIEVYARELGNEVPRHFAMNSKKSENSIPNVAEGGGSDEDIQMEDDDKLCSPDDVIDKVTVDYGGDYVVSQLLQWVSGGIGVKKGLPDIYGCVTLPPINGCWDEIPSCEVKASNYTTYNKKTKTEYAAKARPKLTEWIGDRYQRGSPWEEDLAKYFCPLNKASPDATMPIGSPVLDYLVTGHDDNIRHISAALSGKATTDDQGKSKQSKKDRLQSTVDEGMPAQAVANWVQCENPKCLKWRKLPWHVDVDLLPETFYCKDNIWNQNAADCEASEDEWDMDDAPIKFDTNAYNFEIGVWFDVQREGKIGYHEATVAEVDFESTVKRVKFHFWRLSSDRDEWIEVGSPRIAPHHSYTPRPKTGYKTSDISGDNKISNNVGEKRKAGDMDEAVNGEGSTQDRKKGGFQVFPQSTIDYLNSWISLHRVNPFPDAEEKARICADTGLSKRQVGDWMARARKKLRKQSNDKKKSPSATVSSISSSPSKVENLLLSLKNPNSQAQLVPGVKAGVAAPSNESESEMKGKTTIKELEVYMKTWLANPANANNLMPSSAQKDQIVLETGIEKNRLEGWFYRARQKLKKVEASNQGQSVLSAATASTVLAMTTIVSSSSSGSPSTPKPLSDEAKRGLTKWVEEHQVHPFPSRGEKDAFKKLYGIENDPQLDGYLCRARKKYKKKMDESKSRMAAPIGQSAVGQSAAATQTNSNLSLSSGASTPTIANLTTKAQVAVSQAATNQVATNPQNTKFSSLASLFSAAELHASRNQNQATTAPPQPASYGTHNNGPSTGGADRSREAAIISSFQSLKQIESHTQDSRALINRATADYSSYQRQLGQQGANGNSSYNQQGQNTGHGSYQQGGTSGSYQQQQYHQVQQHQRVNAPATYSSHSQPVVSHQNSQQQRPSAYPYQHSQGQHQQHQQSQQQQRAYNPVQHQQSQGQQGHSYSQGKPNNGQH